MADLTDPRDILRAKVRSEQPKDKTARLRGCFTEIQEARHRGFSYVDIAEWLKPTGIQVTGKQLAEIMCRLRKSQDSPAPVSSLTPDRPPESVLDVAKRKLTTGNKPLWGKEREDR